MTFLHWSLEYFSSLICKYEFDRRFLKKCFEKKTAGETKGEEGGESVADEAASAAEDYVAAIEALFEDEVAAAEMAEAGRVFVADRFSWEPCYRHLLDLVDELAAPKLQGVSP